MGWAGGSGLMSGIIGVLKPKVTDDVRRQVYVELIGLFEGEDADTLKECFDDDPVFVEAYCVDHPREAGYQAFGRGEPRESNPHPDGDEDRIEWDDGWAEAKSDARDDDDEVGVLDDDDEDDELDGDDGEG